VGTPQARTELIGKAAARPARRRRARQVGSPALWFAAPAIAIYALIVLYPSVAGAYYAFTDWSGIGSAKWVGLENFKTLFRTTSRSGRW
jgi:raffinose/stachyose/melibiose transport system permease protein